MDGFAFEELAQQQEAISQQKEELEKQRKLLAKKRVTAASGSSGGCALLRLLSVCLSVYLSPSLSYTQPKVEVVSFPLLPVKMATILPNHTYQR